MDEIREENIEETVMYPAEPQVMPELTYWPFGAGFGMFFLLFGLITTWILSVVGLVLMIISFAGWIININHDTEAEQHE